MKVIFSAAGLLVLATFVSMSLSQDDDFAPSRPQSIRRVRPNPPPESSQPVPVREEDSLERPGIDRGPFQPPPIRWNETLPSPDGSNAVRMDSDGTVTQYRVKKIQRTVEERHLEPLSDDEIKEHEAFSKALQSLKNAKDDAVKKKATEAIQKYLASQFEQDQVQREKELAAAEERVKALRKQFDKRKAARDEIITLRLKTLINSAEGLGFPGDEGPIPNGDFNNPNGHMSPVFNPQTYYPPGVVRPRNPITPDGYRDDLLDPPPPADFRGIPVPGEETPFAPPRPRRVPQPDDE
jgi:hypothetical protein